MFNFTGINLVDNTIGYKPPKYLAELKLLRERQAKQQLPAASAQIATPAITSLQSQALPQSVVVNSPQVVGGTVVLPVVVDTSQPVVQVIYFNLHN